MEHTTQLKHAPLLVRWSLVAGIVIVLNMFFNYTISLVYKEPVYPNTQSQIIEQIKTQQSCIAIGGQWTEAPIAPMPDNTQPKSAGYCDPDYTARLEYEAAHKVYDRNVFIVLAVLGILSLVGGTLLSVEILALAFSWGGVLSLLIASMRYWSAADNLIKVLILGAALGALIWVTVKKFGK